MIRFADETTRSQVWQMWKRVFGDSDEYMQLYFRHKYRDENTLIYIEDSKVVASLQMLPYQFTFCGEEIPVIYLSGVSTLPEYRRRGHVRQLMLRCFLEAEIRNVPLVLLVPQGEWLLQFYNRFGFAQTFDAGGNPLPSLEELIEKYSGDLRKAFSQFDTLFRNEDMTIQKSFEDFKVIVEEASLFRFPAVHSLIGMSRVIDAGQLLSLFANRYQDRTFLINVNDDILKRNNTQYAVAHGRVEKLSVLLKQGFQSEALQFTVDVKELAQLLLGYHTSAKPEPFRSIFPEKRPQMHFMLE